MSDVYEKLTTSGILDLMKEELGEDGIEELHQQYVNPRINVTPMSHRVITGKALILARAVLAKGGTKEEGVLALKNLLVCIDSMKYKLDHKKFQQENDIASLVNKYKK